MLLRMVVEIGLAAIVAILMGYVIYQLIQAL